MTPAFVRPRGRLAVIVGVAILVVLYVVVVVLYAFSGQIEGSARTAPDGRSVQLEIRPQSVDAVGERIPATLEVVSGGPLDPDNTVQGALPVLSDQLDLVVTDTDGSRALSFPAEEVLSPTSVRFIASGEVEQWPFDRYTVQTTIVAYRTVDGEAQHLPLRVFAAGHVPGWTMSAETKDLDATIQTASGPLHVDTVVITARRSGATIAFGVVLLALMVAMPVLVLVVAITVFRGRRKVEASFMSWMGAMLFATIPLRTFLPGSPPIGSWVDFTLVLWVIGALIAGLAIYVAAWLRHSAPPEAAPSAPAAPAPGDAPGAVAEPDEASAP